MQLNAREQRALAAELVHDILGLGPLEPLLEDESIANIMVNGPDRTFVERGGKLTLSNIRFRDTAHLQNICQRIAAAVGRRVDESSPMVDARLRDGSRVNIVFPPLALDGPYVSIRKFGRKTVDFAKLIEWKALTAQVAHVLEIASQARLNVVISGGTGSGKTTMMNAMSRRLIDHGERVITVEDAQAAYRQALGVSPSMPAARVNMALSLAMSGNGERAQQIIGPIATEAGASRKLRHDYAAVLAMSGNRSEAERILGADLAPAEVREAMDGFASARASQGAIKATQ